MVESIFLLHEYMNTYIYQLHLYKADYLKCLDIYKKTIVKTSSIIQLQVKISMVYIE